MLMAANIIVKTFSNSAKNCADIAHAFGELSLIMMFLAIGKGIFVINTLIQHSKLVLLL
jgi:hypothetical protein